MKRNERDFDFIKKKVENLRYFSLKEKVIIIGIKIKFWFIIINQTIIYKKNQLNKQIKKETNQLLIKTRIKIKKFTKPTPKKLRVCKLCTARNH